MCNKGESSFKEWVAFHRKLDLLARNSNASRYKNTIICWICNFFGNIAKYCHTMKCYVWDKYGHKSLKCFLKKSSAKETWLAKMYGKLFVPRVEVGYAPKLLEKKCISGGHKK